MKKSKVNRLMILSSMSCCVVWLLTGCGQSGPLYLPEKTPAAIAVTSSLQPTPAAPCTSGCVNKNLSSVINL